MTTTTHTDRCIQMAMGSISDNNLDTLVERGIYERLAGLEWLASNRIIDAELEAGYAAQTLTEPTEANAARWLDEASADCNCV